MEELPALVTSSLPDDVILEILARINDVAALFRCATTCMGWRCLIMADPSFLRGCLQENVCGSSPFAGFFVQQKSDRSALGQCNSTSFLARQWCDTGTLVPCLVPAPRPVLGTGRRFLDSFIHGVDNPTFFDDAVPLVSRHGLLLVRLNRPRHTSVQLVVCNILAGTFQLLPCLERLDLYTLDSTGYAILTATDCSTSNDEQHQTVPFFKVLVIDIREKTVQYRLRTFSSTGEPRWTLCSGNLECSDTRPVFRQRNVVVCRGIAHWLLWGSSFHTIEVCAKTNHVSLSRLPVQLHNLMYRIDYDEPYFSIDHKERLTLIYLQKEHLLVEMWTWHDNMSWMTSQVLGLQQPDREKNEIGRTLYWCLGEKSGTLLVRGNCPRIYTIDARSGVMREIMDWPHDYHNICRVGRSRKKFVLMEMDWPAFFVSRLGIAK